MGFSAKTVSNWIDGTIINASVLGNRLDQIQIQKPAPLSESGPTEISFFFSKVFQDELTNANPGILITSQSFIPYLENPSLPLWTQSVIITCPDPYWAMAYITEKLTPHFKPQSSSIHPTAILADGVTLGENVQIGAYCIIERGCSIGEDSVLYAYCYIGENSTIGSGCTLFPRVTLYPLTVLESRVRIHSGSVLGADGFGYAPRATVHGKGHQKIFHSGKVFIGEDVEIGANSTVDRATFGETRIEKHAKLDNLVHVGHNAKVDEGAILCGGTCLAGNAHIGKYALIGGLTGVSNHVHVGDYAKVGACSLVTKNIPTKGTAVGNTQRTYAEHFRAQALLNQLLLKLKRRHLK